MLIYMKSEILFKNEWFYVTKVLFTRRLAVISGNCHLFGRHSFLFFFGSGSEQFEGTIFVVLRSIYWGHVIFRLYEF